MNTPKHTYRDGSKGNTPPLKDCSIHHTNNTLSTVTLNHAPRAATVEGKDTGHLPLNMSQNYRQLLGCYMLRCYKPLTSNPMQGLLNLC